VYHCKHCWLFYDCRKKAWIVCVCNYFVCVIANNAGYLWLHRDCVCVVKATWLFGYFWLQDWIVCDCNSRFVVIAKKPEQCVFATILCVSLQTLLVILWKKEHAHCFVLQLFYVCVWLEPEVICGCNMTVSVRYLVIWLFMIANLNSVCLQLFCVCDCNEKLSVVATWLCLCC
jgi:hypothetical protein